MRTSSMIEEDVRSNCHCSSPRRKTSPSATGSSPGTGWAPAALPSKYTCTPLADQVPAMWCHCPGEKADVTWLLA